MKWNGAARARSVGFHMGGPYRGQRWNKDPISPDNFNIVVELESEWMP